MFDMSKSWLPKVFGLIAVIAGCIAVAYSDAPSVMLLGLPAFKFFGMIAAASTGGVGFVSRQDNKSSEQVGAGVITLPTLTDDQKKLLKAKFEAEAKIEKEIIK